MSGFVKMASMICASVGIIHAQTLQFVEERIELQIHDSYCLLTGTYTFKNHTPGNIAWGVFYPLLETCDLPFPDSISVFDADDEGTVPFSTSAEGIGFQARTCSVATSTYRVSYRQKTPARKMEYILSTTKKWGQPLERATFVITVPDSLQLIALSIPYDSVERIRGSQVYRVERIRFMPEENLVVQWRRQQQ